jgi:carbon monoxide dehydrogenase subunit G
MMTPPNEEHRVAKGLAEASIDRAPNDVWNVVRDFGGLANYMPGVDSCTVDGDVRTVGTMGIEVKEQLRELDDDTRRISYSVIESPMGNMTSHLATIGVDAEGGGTHFTWAVEVEPDELLPLFQGIYEQSVVALKEKLES